MKTDTKELELYIHIPFCVKKCNYCDFLSFSGNKKIQDEYLEALLEEIMHTDISPEMIVTSIFIGGGTPSVIDEEWIAAILFEVRRKFSLSDEIEITIETNPGTITKEKLLVYKRAGINRLSMGLQSANDEELKRLGRIHTFDEFCENYQLARKCGFTNINIDLMMALPGQNLQSALGSIRQTVRLHPEHISAYSLIIEPQTPFAAMSDLDLPGEDEEREIYEAAVRELTDWGYKQYEISNFAVPGKECRHNIGYWQRKPYLGLGLGAASLYYEERFHNTYDLKEYIHFAKEPHRLKKERETLDKKARMEEFIFLGLRMTDGISEETFLQQFGQKPEAVYADVLKRYTDSGHLRRSAGRIFLTQKGIAVSNVIMADFLL